MTHVIFLHNKDFMKLQQYFDLHRTNKAAFCRDIGITPTGLQKILQGHGPNLETACSIENITNGLVSVKDLYLDWCEKNQKKPYSKVTKIYPQYDEK